MKLTQPKPPTASCQVVVPRSAEDHTKLERCNATCLFGEFICPDHWRLVDRPLKQMIFERQKQDKKRGLRVHGEEWRELAMAALKTVTMRLLRDLQKEKPRGNGAPQEVGDVAKDARDLVGAEHLPRRSGAEEDRGDRVGPESIRDGGAEQQEGSRGGPAEGAGREAAQGGADRRGDRRADRNLEDQGQDAAAGPGAHGDAATGPEVEAEQEPDGRWLAEVMNVPGALAYGATKEEAIAAARAIADQVEPRPNDAVGVEHGR